MKAPTSRDIARLAGVSQTTVSRVLNEPDRVQPETRELILKTMREAGYRPSAAGRLMRTGRSHVVALVVSNLALNPIYPVLLHRLIGALRDKGYDASVWETEAITEATVKSLSESSVDGVIIATAVESASRWVAAIAEAKPTVLVHRSIALPRVDRVTADNLRGGASVAEYFHANGRKAPALVDVAVEASTIQQRVEGYRQALRRLKLALPRERVVKVARSTYAEGFAAARHLVEAGPPDAIFCVVDIVAIGLLDGLRALGVQVPKQTWVVGCDDIPMSEWGAIGLSSVRQPIDAMSLEAVERLCERMGGSRTRAREKLLASEIMVRASSG
jgi:LacI family transcriptional regulator